MTANTITLNETPSAVVNTYYPTVKAFRKAMRELAKSQDTGYQVENGAYSMYIGQFLYCFRLCSNGRLRFDILSD